MTLSATTEHRRSLELHHPIPIPNFRSTDMQLVTRDDSAWVNEGVAHSAPSSLQSCRRAASFPYFDEHVISPPLAIKGRSLSESQGLNRFTTIDILDILKGLDTRRECPLPSPIAEEEDNVTTFEEPDELEEEPVVEDSCDLIDELSNLDISDECRARRVRFADDVGEELVKVRVLDLSPNAPPPVIPQAVLERHRGPEQHVPKVSWTVGFEQPASNWQKFNDSLRNNKIAMENAVVSNATHLLCTVKVDASLPADRTTVYARYTTDNWKTFTDAAAQAPTRGPCGSYHCYSLHLVLPADARAGDFAYLCFYSKTQHDGWVEEHWDSNDGHNFMFEVPMPTIQEYSMPATIHSWSTPYSQLDRNDAYRLEYDNWAKFASWKSLSTEGPYW